MRWCATPAGLADRSSRGGRWWIAAGGVGVIGGLANYLLAARQTAPAAPPGVRAAALLAAQIDLACWLLLGLLWVVFLGALRAGRRWAAVGLAVTAGVAVILDLMNLVGSWATVVAGLAQLVLLVIALLALPQAAGTRR
jgi:hypothetical protein